MVWHLCRRVSSTFHVRVAVRDVTGFRLTMAQIEVKDSLSKNNIGLRVADMWVCFSDQIFSGQRGFQNGDDTLQ
jgi:hypothetical protein